MRHLGDITKLKGKDVPFVDIMTGGSPCFTGDTLVTTEDGQVPIKDVAVGMKVLTHKNRFRKVTDSACTGTKQVYRITGMGFNPICATANHPFWVRTRKRVWNNDRRSYDRVFSAPEWTPVNKMERNVYVGIIARAYCGKSPSAKYAFHEDGYIWVPVWKIEFVGRKKVYNLSVAEDESYCANNVIVHNCQSLSVAGKREGLRGESGLFLEQVRLFKEMRDANRDSNGFVRGPRFLVWENVKGAFSCSGGEDFRCVLEEIARVAEPDAVIPRPPTGVWSPSGAIVGSGWSIAWRLHDAQFWGVPQRRTRIALVADFGGESAAEVLFERKGGGGDSVPRRTQREETSGNTPKDAGGTSKVIRRGDGRGDGVGLQCGNPWDSQTGRVYHGDGTWHTLDSNNGGGQARDGILVKTPRAYSSDPGASRDGEDKAEEPYALGFDPTAVRDIGRIWLPEKSKAITVNSGNGYSNGVCVAPLNTMVCEGRPDPKNDARMGLGIGEDGDPANTLSRAHSHGGIVLKKDEEPSRCMSVDLGGGKSSVIVSEEQSPTLTTTHDGHPAVFIGKEEQPITCIEPRSADGGAPRVHHDDVSPTLNTMQGGGNARA